MISLDDRIARLNRHRGKLIGTLREGWECGSQAKPFDEAAVWKKIESVIYLYDASERTREEVQKIPAKQRAKSYNELAHILRDARSKIDERVYKPELRGPIFLLAVDAHTAMVKLEDECKKAAKQALRRGRPKGTAVLRDGTIIALARCFEEATGFMARAYRIDGNAIGQFAYFVRDFLKADGRNSITLATVVEYIKKALAHARRSAPQSTPQSLRQ
jgi:hypothetical protein